MHPQQHNMVRAGRPRSVVRLFALAGTLALLGALGLLPNAESGEEASKAEIEKKIQDVLGAKDLPEAQRGYRSLFRMASLPELRRHENDSISLQAAWEEVVLTVPEGEHPGLPPEKLEWFLGFMEGRLGVQPPQWWTDIVLDARSNRRENIYFLFPKPLRYQEAGLDLIHAPRGTTMKREGGKVVLTIGEQSAMVPEDLFQEAGGKLYGGVSAVMSPRRCYVAVHDFRGSPYQLACIDRGSDKVLWRSRVRAAYYASSATGVGQDMWVAVTEQNGRVMVFGVFNVGIHVEAFRADDGANLFRFAGGTDFG